MVKLSQAVTVIEEGNTPLYLPTLPLYIIVVQFQSFPSRFPQYVKGCCFWHHSYTGSLFLELKLFQGKRLGTAYGFKCQTLVHKTKSSEVKCLLQTCMLPFNCKVRSVVPLDILNQFTFNFTINREGIKRKIWLLLGITRTAAYNKKSSLLVPFLYTGRSTSRKYCKCDMASFQKVHYWPYLSA